MLVRTFSCQVNPFTEAVQLGSYQEMVYEHNPKNRISLAYEWNLKEALRFKDPVSKKSFSGDTLSFAAQVGLSEKSRHALTLDCLEHQLLKGGESTMTVGMKQSSGNKSEYKTYSKGYELKKQVGRAWHLKETVNFYGFPDQVVAYHQNADFVQDLADVMVDVINSREHGAERGIQLIIETHSEHFLRRLAKLTRSLAGE